MAKIVYSQMPAPRQLSQQIPAPQAKARMQKPQGECAGGMVMDEIDTCIKGVFRGYYFWTCPVHLIWHLKSVLRYDIHMISLAYIKDTCCNWRSLKRGQRNKQFS